MSYYINTEQQIGIGNSVGRYYGGMRRFPVIPYTPNEDNDPNPSREPDEIYEPEDMIEEAKTVIEELESELANPDIGAVTRANIEREIAGMRDVIEEQKLLLDNQPMEQEDQGGVEESKTEESKVMDVLQGDIQEGDGLLVREAGQLEPSGRQLLSDIGDEEIKTIDIVRTPLSSFTKTFLNIISLGQFEKISKKYYDEMFHLSLWINGKYNLEKNEVVKFNRENPKKSNSQVKSVSVIPAGITIQQLIDNAIKRMGKENFSNYDAERLNCQNFVLNVLDGSNIGDKSDGEFIFQDASKIFQELPEYSKVLGKVSVKLGAIFNRLMYGEGNLDDFMKRNPNYKSPTLQQSGERFAKDIERVKKYYGGASIGQIGEAAALRTWTGKLKDPVTGLPMRDTLNKIVHSGDRPGSSQWSIDNPFNDIYNDYNPEIDARINWAGIRSFVDNNKRPVSFFTPTYPSRTLGAT